MNARKLFISLFAATSMAAAPLAMAEMGRTESTIVGAAVGGVAGSLIGGDMQSTLLGAAAGGLLGNLISKNNSDMMRDREARRYQACNSYRPQHVNARGNSRYGHQQWQNGRGHGRSGMARGHGHR